MKEVVMKVWMVFYLWFLVPVAIIAVFAWISPIGFGGYIFAAALCVLYWVVTWRNRQGAKR